MILSVLPCRRVAPGGKSSRARNMRTRVSDFLVAPRLRISKLRKQKNCSVLVAPKFSLVAPKFSLVAPKYSLVAPKLSLVAPSGIEKEADARSDLQSDRTEYKDLQSDYRITNAYTHRGWITNPAEPPAARIFFHERPPHEKMEAAFFHEWPAFFHEWPAFFHERPAFFCPRPWDIFLLTLHHSPINTVYQLSTLHPPPSTFHPPPNPRCNQKVTHARIPCARKARI